MASGVSNHGSISALLPSQKSISPSVSTLFAEEPNFDPRNGFPALYLGINHFADPPNFEVLPLGFQPGFGFTSKYAFASLSDTSFR